MQPERYKKFKENSCDLLYNYSQDNGEVEAEKWDVVDDESGRAHGMDDR